MDGLNYDPKQIITPDAFRVAPKLLGKPLATPKRRLAAVLIDLSIAGIFSLFNPYLLAALATLAVLWIIIRKKSKTRFKKGMRVAFAVAGSVFIFSGVYSFIQETSAEEERTGLITAKEAMSSEAFKEFTSEAMSIDYTNNPESEEEIQDLIQEYTEEALENNFSMSADSAKAKPLPENASQILRSYATALQTDNKTMLDSLRPTAARIVVGQRLSELERRVHFYKTLNDTLMAENAKLNKIVENPGFLRTIKAGADNLGLAVGWLGLYFVLMLTLGHGQTPGKKIMSLRVIHLNNQPVTLWKSFERFGGYAAGFATGLLGFMQVYWDANRQGIHDKIAGTTVIDLREKKAKKYQDLVDDFIETGKTV